MILPCPACQARFMVPDERITPRGIKIRCPKCRFVFIMKAQKRSVATPMEVPASAGAIAAPAPIKKKKKKKPPRERLPEAEAAKLTEDELAAMEEDEIVDMDDLAQPTEQSGTAYNPNVKEEHFQPVAQSAPSVMIDDSLLTAAAAHSASWTTAPVAADDLPRMSPSAAVSDTWIDLPGKETPTYPPLPAAPPPEPRGVVTSGSMGSTSGAIASGSMGSASGAIASGSMGSASGAIASGSMGSASGAIASGSMGSASGAIASGSMGSASGAIASGSMGSASGAIGAPAKPSPPPAPRATEEEVWPEPSLELELEPEPEPEPELAEASAEAPASPDALPDTSDTIPGDVMSPFLAREAPIPTAAALPVAGLAPTPRPAGAQGVLASVVPSPQTREEYQSGGMEETFTPPA
ncbi:MAG: zinc-ribbon domain-containing protein, partial [Polyangia bacterium]|nr:zinc-ribbon domain-containing protein [Polyangia bacterium]